MKTTTFKKSICILLSTVLFCTISVNAYAISDTSPDSGISPRYVELSVIQSSLSISDKGTASCSCDVSTRQPGSSVKIQMMLQQKQTSTWKTIKTWNKADTSPCSLVKEYAVKKGYDYQLYVEVTVYDENGKEIEQATGYSKIVHY